jgi:arginyl-tRNA synthetase
MPVDNPFGKFRKECETILTEALKKALPEIIVASLAFEKPVNPEFGQLASSISFETAKHLGRKPLDLAKLIIKAVDKSRFRLTEQVVPAGAGYINFHVDYAKLSALTLDAARRLDTCYGLVKTEKPVRIIVEHTSVNPLHPIHIGQARNPMLGDTLARLLKARGHTVYRHYYVDDVGRQSSVLAYGYEKLGRPETEEEPDRFLGKIYTITSCLTEINRLKKELDRAKTVQADEETARVMKELDEWVGIAAELRSSYSSLFDELLAKLGEGEDSEAAISKLNLAYEKGEKKAKQLVQEVSKLCLQGFTQTLGRIDVSYDSFDWESSHVWGRQVADALDRLKKTPYVFEENGVFEFDASKVVEDLGLREKLRLGRDHDVPSLTLVRADGTTLYTTRDVAYTLWKFTKADRFINVIGVEQSLSQLHLKIALYALGYAKQADNLVHFAYNLVTLPGYKMSSRRGRYITFDEVMDEAVKRAFEEVSKRSPQLSEEEKSKIAEFVGIGAVRYALVEVDTSKPVVFTWDRVLNFERNSAPYIQYTHARACSILRKAEKKAEKPDTALLTENIEKEILLTLASFPDTFTEAAEYLKPNLIADYANALADEFNTFYNDFPVIKAETPELSNVRLALVDAVRIVLRNALSLIGIVAPERM